MIIYLAELLHTGKGRSPNTVPLAAGYLAAYTKKYFPDIEITIFRDAEELLRAVRRKPPDVVGLSIRLWSERLANFCARRIREISKNTTIVAGGQSIDDKDAEILTFLKQHSYYDVAIPSEGEVSFVRLIEHLKKHGRLIPDAKIEGCAKLASNGTLLRGAYTPPTISEIPSPYLEGLLDRFLAEGYDPVIQSMRGCPYSCTFCVSGTSVWSKLRPYDLKRVFAEFEYVKRKSKSDFLIFTDENFGVLGERDIKIAEYVLESFKSSNYPSRVYCYTAKIVTDDVLKTAEIFAPIGEFGISFQSMNPGVIKEIKRVNIKYEKFLDLVKWALKRKIVMSTEMIFGFPGETVESYLEGLEHLLRSNVDRIYSYNLRLFSGIDLALPRSRDKYELKTKYRLPERTYGLYDNHVVTEVEEVVVGSNSFDYEGYRKIRKYGWFLELASGRGYFSELMRMMIKLGLPGEKLVTFLTEHPFDRFPRLSSIVNDYSIRTKGELFNTTEECIDYVDKLISNGQQVPEVKLNLIFIGKIICDHVAKTELFEVVKEFVRKVSRTEQEAALMTDYVDNILFKKIVTFTTDEKPVIHSCTRICLDKIEQDHYGSIEDLWLEEPVSLAFTLHKDAVAFIQKTPLRNTDDEMTLQDIYMKVFRFGLLRQREIKTKVLAS